MPRRTLPESCASRITASKSDKQSLFANEWFAIDDWHCDGHDTPRGKEEWNDADRVVITRGGAFAVDAEGRHALSDQSTATLWRKGSTYRVTHPAGGRDRCTVFRLTDAGSDALVEPTRANAPGPFAWRVRAVEGRAYLSHRIALLRARNRVDDALAIEEPALAFLRTVTDVRHDAPPGPRADDYANHAREIIARDFRRRLSLLAVARAVNCSPFHLARLFRRATGTTMHRAVLQLRLREAMERILDGAASLSAVAHDVGFSSHGHFTDAFRREFGMTPQSVRAL